MAGGTVRCRGGAGRVADDAIGRGRGDARALHTGTRNTRFNEPHTRLHAKHTSNTVASAPTDSREQVTVIKAQAALFSACAPWQQRVPLCHARGCCVER